MISRMFQRLSYKEIWSINEDLLRKLLGIKPVQQGMHQPLMRGKTNNQLDNNLSLADECNPNSSV